MSREKEYRLTPDQIGAAWGAGVFLAGVAASTFIGGQIDAVNERGDKEDYQQTHETIVELTDTLDEAEHNYIRFENDLTEGCRVILRRYLANGELAVEAESGVTGEEGTTANIDTAVDDALREPHQPCGNSASEIRTSITRLSQEKDTLLSAGPQLDQKQAELSKTEPKNRSQGIIGWAIGGTVVSAVGAACAKGSVRYRLKYK